VATNTKSNSRANEQFYVFGSVRTFVRRAVDRYIDINQKIGETLFDRGEQLSRLFERTPIYPAIEFQQTFSRKAFEFFVRGARRLADSL